MESCIWHLIGHRGVGKSSLAKRLQMYFPNMEIVDLDSAIVEATGQSISALFCELGEKVFRELEVSTLKKIKKRIGSATATKLLVVGAGCELGHLGPTDRTIWVRRSTDREARIFVDRPRLEAGVSSQQEYLLRFDQREPMYRAAASLVYEMPEGLPNAHIEKEIFAKWFANLPVVIDSWLTLPSQRLDLVSKFQPNLWELRNDLQTDEEIGELLASEDRSFTKFLFSYRRPSTSRIPESALVDCDVRLASSASLTEGATKTAIISSHAEDIHSGKTELLGHKTGTHLKLCPRIESWSDLNLGWQWQQEDPKHRSFLPRSETGRWRWFRLWQHEQQRVNFISIGWSEISDQPSLYWFLQQQRFPSPRQGFGAVLGWPVDHSQSPTFHTRERGRDRQNFYAIPLRTEEWDDALPLLIGWGLQRAAVTSPLKATAYEWAQKQKIGGLEFVAEAINTLKFANSRLSQVANTDLIALQSWFAELNLASDTTIWGGGGLLPTLKELLPGARTFRHREGTGTLSNLDALTDLIWAAGASSGPLPSFKPGQIRRVIDLSYNEDSRGREVAVATGSQYISGQRLFELQAHYQQKIWWPSVGECETSEL